MSDTAHILVIEDDVSLSQLLKMLLQKQGYRVDIAYDGASGLQCCRSTRYDLVLVDYIMPAMDGLEVLRYASTHQLDMPPIIFMTGSGSESVAVEAMKLGALDYIVKGSGQAFVDAVVEAVSDAITKVQQRKKVLASAQQPSIASDAHSSTNSTDSSCRTDMITICAWTGEVFHNGEWMTVEDFLRKRFGFQVSHGISPKAIKRYGHLFKPHT
ncbi:MAG: response regulator [Candidatus Thermochlorobacter sp.]